MRDYIKNADSLKQIFSEDEFQKISQLKVKNEIISLLNNPQLQNQTQPCRSQLSDNSDKTVPFKKN